MSAGNRNLLAIAYLSRTFSTAVTTSETSSSVSFADSGKLTVCRPMRIAFG